MKYRFYLCLLIALAAIGLSGCAKTYIATDGAPRMQPPPRPETAPAPAPAPATEPTPVPGAPALEPPRARALGGYGESSTAATPVRYAHRAVARLSDQASAQAQSGELDAALATTERALRIDPGNAALWQQLAGIQLERGNHQQAEQLARKSLLLADTDALRAKNWRLIQDARNRRGDTEGAADAEERAAELETP